MAIDAQLGTLLNLLNGGPPLSAGTPEQARRNLRTFTVDMRDPATKAAVHSVEDRTVPGGSGPRPARVYRPEHTSPVPTVLYAHGGGYVLGDLDTHDDHARLLCRELGSVVVSVDYRLAPEHPFPAGHEDVVAALGHVVAAVDEFGGDLSRVAVAGDSAGGNLVAGAAVVARDRGWPLAAQLLLYPSTDFTDATYPSRAENAAGYFLTAEHMWWFREQYRPDPADPRASILHQPDLVGVAPALVVSAEHDPLRDDGEFYAAALERGGVPVKTTRYDGLIHGFMGLTHVHDASHAASLAICADFKELLA